MILKNLKNKQINKKHKKITALPRFIPREKKKWFSSQFPAFSFAFPFCLGPSNLLDKNKKNASLHQGLNP
jgi:hypothetical protein